MLGWKPIRIALAALLVASVAMGRSDSIVELRGVEGDVERIFEESKASVLVFLFVAVECPISNRYAPAVNALYERYASDDLAFWTVYTDDLFSKEAIRRHRNDFEYKASSLIDFNQTATSFCRTTVTPEAAVFARDGDGHPRMVYGGRIDNRYVDFGKWRPKPSKEDLLEVLEAASKGEAGSLEFRATRAVGCYISPN